MQIGIDAMGGDFAPLECIKGILQVRDSLGDDVNLVLFGDEPILRTILQEHAGTADLFTIIHAPEVIGMAESPTKALSQKSHSSIAIGFHYLKQGKIDAFASAGNTGAMLVGAMYSVKTIEGVMRPAISTLLPHSDDKMGLLLDIGANADCKPEVLLQFGIMGSLYAEHIYKINNPKVALLSIGEEEGKGNLLVQAAYPLFQECETINFIGNVEGRDIFGDKADVVVTDGFTGNIVLKFGESIYDMIKKQGIRDKYWDRFNYENYGGSAILGANAPVVVAHGISNAIAFQNMILLAKQVIESRIVEVFKDAFINHHAYDIK
ncbi:MAG: phosphate acyltransferase PlsX [Chitinophagales bacterium]|jgi:glycerol-3-phosphate acyltransferase PlsX|nr:phosphate acyltransferase PlsX [Chitinophagales bacterium]